MAGKRRYNLLVSALAGMSTRIGRTSMGDTLRSILTRLVADLTGFNSFHGELGAKGLALLHELVPSIATIGFLENPEQSGI
jgi:hypothetical protein